MAGYVLCLGSNVGGRLRNMLSAARIIAESFRVVGVSHVYLTEPVGPPQPWFLNACLKVESGFDPFQMLEFSKRLERRVGRVQRFNKGPREIDVDIIWSSTGGVKTDVLTVPHPHWSRRRFVVRCLIDLGFERLDGVELRLLERELSSQALVRSFCASCMLRDALLNT